MRDLTRIFALLLGLLIGMRGAEAALIQVDLSTQTMRVTSSQGDYVWPISSARSGYVTPRGSYGVQRLEAMHYSRKYHHSPMPHSIFFRGGYAIHGTYATGSLGAPASHGCIRIAPENAAALYQIVRAEGARISITGAPVSNTRYAKAQRRERAQAIAARPLPVQPAMGYAAPQDAPSFDDWVRAPAGPAQPAPNYHYPDGFD